MKTKDVETDVGSTDLASYILAVTEQLKRERKFAAAHGYVSVLHSFQDFAGGRGIPLPMDEVFTPMRLKAYEADADEKETLEDEQRDQLHELTAGCVQPLDARRHTGIQPTAVCRCTYTGGVSNQTCTAWMADGKVVESRER